MKDLSTAKTLAFIITGGVFSVVVMLMFIPIPESNKTMVDNIIMAVVTAWVGAMGFFYGNTANTAVKPTGQPSPPADPKSGE